MTARVASRLIAPGTAGFQPAPAAPDPGRSTAVRISMGWKHLGEVPIQYGDIMEDFETVTDTNTFDNSSFGMERGKHR